MEGREVSCRILRVFFDELRTRGIPADYLVEGSGLRVDDLQDRNRRIGWETFRRVMANAGRMWSDDQLAEISGRFPLHPAARPFAVAARVFVEPGDLYRWVVSEKGPVRNLVHCVRFELREISPREHEVVLRMEPGYAPCPEYAAGARGAIAATPRLLGLPPAEVRMEPGADAVRYFVRTNGRGGAIARLRRSVRWLLDSRAVAAELREAYDSLQNAHERLLEETAQRARAERALRERENQLHWVIDHAPVAVFALDREGTVTLSEGRALRDLGLAPGERVGRNVFEFHKDHPTIPGDTRRALAGEAFHTTARVGDVTIETWFMPHYDENGRLDGTVGVALDVTERLALETEVRRRDRMRALGTLAGGIAHDFNHVLTAVLGNAQLAASKLPEDHEVLRHLEEIRQAGSRARGLVDQILTFSRSDAPARRPLPVQDAVRDALDFLRSTFPRCIEVRESLDAPLAVVDANPTQIQQVVLNLGSNAQDAVAPAGGTVEIALAEVDVDDAEAKASPDLRPGPYVRLTVRDTGCGIADDVMDRIFDPFFSTKEEGRGSGLGLSVVHGIVREHGGAIRVRSAPGAGTTVEVLLPRIPAAPRSAPRVLFVDDDEQIARCVGRMLEGIGCEARTSSSGEEALERLQEDPGGFDLVITDQNMARMSGTGLVEQVRRIRPELPVILCTGYVDDFTRDFAHRQGFRAYLAKPVEPGELERSVRQVLSGGVPRGD
jgi:PAS domain S-box-containing protein